MTKVGIATLWVTRKSEPGHPELVCAWDEFDIEGNWEGWAEACRKAKESIGDDLDQYRYFDVVIDFRPILESFQAGRVDAHRVTPMDGPEAFG
jgi:hypothetical protein